MKKMKKFFALVFIILLSGCNDDNLFNLRTGSSSPTSNSGVVPQIINGANLGGNRTCEEAAAGFNLAQFTHTTGRITYTGGAFTGSFGPHLNVTTNGTYVSWTFTPPAGFCLANMAVIVKGGSASNVYYYGAPTYSDSGLASPVNSSGRPARLGHITFCYTLVPCCDWQEETAFGGSNPGPGAGWWFYIESNSSGTYPIYAGQSQVPGAYVQYDGVSDVINIVLGPNLRLQSVGEPVKVEGYDVLPTARPAAGQFNLYKGSSLTVQGDGSRYYVIHLDVEVCS